MPINKRDVVQWTTSHLYTVSLVAFVREWLPELMFAIKDSASLQNWTNYWKVFDEEVPAEVWRIRCLWVKGLLELKNEGRMGEGGEENAWMRRGDP
jgi:hypothetical protein